MQNQGTVVYNHSLFGAYMSREIIIDTDNLADLLSAVTKMLKELKKINLYLAFMTDLEIHNEDVEE